MQHLPFSSLLHAIEFAYMVSRSKERCTERIIQSRIYFQNCSVVPKDATVFQLTRTLFVESTFTIAATLSYARDAMLSNILVLLCSYCTGHILYLPKYRN